MTPAELTLIRLLAAQAVRSHLTQQSSQQQALPADRQNRPVSSAAQSR